MRIDKFLSDMGVCSRSEASKAARSGEIAVDGVTVRRADSHIVPERQTVTFRGEQIRYRQYTYIMLNKPEGYVSATEDPQEKTVLELLDDRCRRLNLFPAGRLDKNTVGFLLLTNDGELAHRLLSPKHHVPKTYFFRAERRITAEDRDRLESGVMIEGRMTKPAKLILQEDGMSGQITLSEGRYHQIKLMLEAVCNKVTFLERISFAGIPLDTALQRGEWRELTGEEERILHEADGKAER